MAVIREHPSSRGGAMAVIRAPPSYRGEAMAVIRVSPSCRGEVMAVIHEPPFSRSRDVAVAGELTEREPFQQQGGTQWPLTTTAQLRRKSVGEDKGAVAP